MALPGKGTSAMRDDPKVQRRTQVTEDAQVTVGHDEAGHDTGTPAANGACPLPSLSVRGTGWAPISRRGALVLGALGFFAAIGVAGQHLPAATAATYPSWDDVQAAKANESAKAAEIQNIQDLIQSLNDEVTRTDALARQAADVFYTAQQEHFESAYRADSLQSQADAEAANAAEAADKAGRVAAQLYRNGSDNTSMELFVSGSAAKADDLLARLAILDKLVERNRTVYAEAITARDTAQSLSDQALVARDERDRLQQVAEQKMIEAQQAADAAQTARDAQAEHLVVLQSQLTALQDTTAKTIADYQAGVEAARIAEEQRRAAERAEADRLAAAASSGTAAPSGGAITGAGWTRPSSGRRTSGYGPRSVQCGSGYCSSGFHYGVDLAAGCGAGIYAASAGRVVYAGYNGGYGNYVKIDHGQGIGSGYAHNRNLYVSNGQWVNAGDLVAAEGNTGNSFGCHVHFEVYLNGAPINPIAFLAERGVSV